MPLKTEIVYMLAGDEDIVNYLVLKADFTWGNLYPLSSDEVITILVKALDAYEETIKYILAELDDEAEPTETTS